MACADEFLERMPKGLDTELGQGGTNVSGGQKQRLCIARTLLKQPKVLIFDDSTSAVDTATEGQYPQRLWQNWSHVTKIIIAQRITSVMNTDQIIILEDGTVHAVGTHQELLKNDPIYQEIYAFPDERRGVTMARSGNAETSQKFKIYHSIPPVLYGTAQDFVVHCGGPCDRQRPGESAWARI